MVIINLIIQKLVIIDDCDTRPTFNVYGQPPLYCAKHKNDTMVDITKKYCTITNCFNRVYYGKPGNKLSHCTKHREKAGGKLQKSQFLRNGKTIKILQNEKGTTLQLKHQCI